MALTETNALSALLRRPTVERRAPDYEQVYDDFIRFAGGDRIEDLFDIPRGVRNADYLLATDAFELVIELKQMNTYRREQTVDAWFNRLIEEDRFRGPRPHAGSRIEVGPESFSSEDWRRFYLKFRPSVTEHLDKAAGQLKGTNGFLPPAKPGRQRLFGVVLLNSNDFNLSTDLLHRLVEWRVREKWKRGLYSHIDFAICTGVDLAHEDRHPLHSRCMVRTIEQDQVAAAARYLFDRWVHYGASAVGAEVQFEPGDFGDDPIRVESKVVGKLQWIPPAADGDP